MELAGDMTQSAVHSFEKNFLKFLGPLVSERSGLHCRGNLPSDNGHPGGKNHLLEFFLVHMNLCMLKTETSLALEQK